MSKDSFVRHVWDTFHCFIHQSSNLLRHDSRTTWCSIQLSQLSELSEHSAFYTIRCNAAQWVMIEKIHWAKNKKVVKSSKMDHWKETVDCFLKSFTIRYTPLTRQDNTVWQLFSCTLFNRKWHTGKRSFLDSQLNCSHLQNVCFNMHFKANKQYTVRKRKVSTGQGVSLILLANLTVELKVDTCFVDSPTMEQSVKLQPKSDVYYTGIVWWQRGVKCVLQFSSLYKCKKSSCELSSHDHWLRVIVKLPPYSCTDKSTICILLVHWKLLFKIIHLISDHNYCWQKKFFVPSLIVRVSIWLFAKRRRIVRVSSCGGSQAGWTFSLVSVERLSHVARSLSINSRFLSIKKKNLKMDFCWMLKS